MSTTKSDLPPSRNRKPALRPVSPPLSNVSMHRFNYWIASAAALLLAFYAWSVVSIKLDQASTGIAMWYHSIFGNSRSSTGSGSEYAQPSTITETSKAKGTSDIEGMSIDERIEDLASALGMPESTDLASAIGEAIRAYIPPASLSSISAHQTGSVINYLVDPTSAAAEAEAKSTVVVEKGFKAAAKAFEAAVGMEEPPSELA